MVTFVRDRYRKVEQLSEYVKTILGRECEKISDNRVNQSHINKYIRRKSVPGLDIAAVIARAAGVSIEWLAGVPERPRRIISDQPDREPSIQTEGRPEHAAPVVLEAPGRYQFVVDVVVKGPIPNRSEDENVQKG